MKLNMNSTPGMKIGWAKSDQKGRENVSQHDFLKIVTELT